MLLQMCNVCILLCVFLVWLFFRSVWFLFPFGSVSAVVFPPMSRLVSVRFGSLWCALLVVSVLFCFVSFRFVLFFFGSLSVRLVSSRCALFGFVLCCFGVIFGSVRFGSVRFCYASLGWLVGWFSSPFRFLTVETAGTQEAGGQKPRVLSIDDYYMAEVPLEGTDERGLKRKGVVMKYQPDAEMEEVLPFFFFFFFFFSKHFFLFQVLWTSRGHRRLPFAPPPPPDSCPSFFMAQRV